MVAISQHGKRKLYSFAMLLLTISPPGIAQPVPNAGRLLQEMEPPPTLPQREAPKLQVDEPPLLQSDEGERIPVQRLRITGATRYGEAELHALVADGEGQRLTLGGLSALADRITRHYRSQGYFLARAYLPAQDIVDGELRIDVIEGRLGRVDVSNSAGIGGQSLSAVTALESDAVVLDATLERSLQLLSDIPGVEVQSTLRPGATVGASDLLVEVIPGRRVTGSVDLDNYGDRFSGEFRLGGTVNFNNPFQIGDQATLRAMGSDEGMRYLRASYQLPINSLGTRMGVAVSKMDYRLGSNLAVLNASGDSSTSSVYALHPFIRSRSFNINGELQFDSKRLNDRIGVTATEINKQVKTLTAGLNADFVDGFGGGASNSASIHYTAGNLHLDSVSRALDQASAETGGHFSKLNGSWLRLQSITDVTSVYLSARGQLADKNLDSSEKFTLGGANSVRAYPQGEASGDEGYLLTVEGRYDWASLQSSLPGFWQASLFMDHGRVRINKNVWAPQDNRRTLSAAGFGLTWNNADGWLLRASIAWKVGSELPISDVDRSPRAWIQLSKSL